jgi:general transcription factor 3C polypeptide 3 (transcription factor C subunit 4)
MGLEHIVPLVDMLIQTEKLEEGVDVVRRGQRWLQGRMEEKHWDVLDDDREYASLDDGEGGDEGNEGNELEVPLRLRLALLRLRLGQDDEAFVSHFSGRSRSPLTKSLICTWSDWLGSTSTVLVLIDQGHINEILSLDVVANQEMFIELGEALMKRELWEKALDCFAPINEEESVRPSHSFSFHRSHPCPHPHPHPHPHHLCGEKRDGANDMG